MSRMLMLLALGVVARQALAQDLFPLWESLDDFRRGWYSAHLAAAGEPAISYPAEGTRYRFTWLRTFGKPIIVGVNCTDSCQMHAVLLSGAGGYEPGEIERETERELNPQEVDDLLSLVRAFDPWREETESDLFGLDGAQWILEVAQRDRYAAWDIWSPLHFPEQQDYVDLGLYLLSLSGFDVPRTDVY